jgi:hypothetical protein
MAAIGAAQACPNMARATDHRGAVEAINHPTKSTVSAALFVMDTAGTAGGQCCGYHGIGCAMGSCSSDSTAIDATKPELAVHGVSSRHASHDHNRNDSISPPPVFRPPRSSP